MPVVVLPMVPELLLAPFESGRVVVCRAIALRGGVLHTCLQLRPLHFLSGVHRPLLARMDLRGAAFVQEVVGAA